MSLSILIDKIFIYLGQYIHIIIGVLFNTIFVRLNIIFTFLLFISFLIPLFLIFIFEIFNITMVVFSFLKMLSNVAMVVFNLLKMIFYFITNNFISAKFLFLFSLLRKVYGKHIIIV